jgi:L-asparagine oxygenase
LETTQRDGADPVWRFAAPPRQVTIVLDHGEQAQVTRRLDELAVRLPDRSLDDHRLLTEVEIAARALPARLLSHLVSFRVTGNGHGMLLIRNVPVDVRLPPTPVDGCLSSWSATARSTLAQLAVMSVLGHVIAYADEKRGALVQDICPLPGKEYRQENTGSMLLELHTEDGFHPFKPDIISLMCLRGDHERAAATVSASVKSVLPRLSEPTLRALREPIYRIRFSTSFVGLDGPAQYSPPLPVLSGAPDDPDLCVDFHAMEPMRPDGAAAFQTLREAMTTTLIGVVLEPGDLFVVDNRVAVHGRTSFVPRYDGGDRWLRRCFAVADLRPSRGLRGHASRVCSPLSRSPLARPSRTGSPTAPKEASQWHNCTT